MLSIVVPTYNESTNVPILINAIERCLSGGTNYEIIFVDDSTDNTPDVLQQLASVDPRVRYEHRENERGLGTAVVRGFRLAKGNVITVLDADLQHPPNMLIPMLKQIEMGYDLVIPSRFVPDGNDGGLAVHRKWVSWVARMMGKLALKKVRPINDPTSGFFILRRQVIESIHLHPIGWKILIEILVRGRYQRVLEMPYQFQTRATGKSKMSFKEQWNYIRHLVKLVKDSPEDRRFYTFALVGMSGVIINMTIYAVLVRLGIAVPVAGTLSALVAMLGNFVVNDAVTWKDVQTGTRLTRAVKYVLISFVGIGIDVAMLHVLDRNGINYLVANLLSIVVAMVWNFKINNLWTWKRNSSKPVISQSSNTVNVVQKVVVK